MILNETDAKAISDLMIKVWNVADYPDEVKIYRQYSEEKVRKLIGEGVVFLGIKKNSSLLACIKVEGAVGVFELKALSVDPNFQRKGYGTKLSQKALEYAQEYGHKAITYVKTGEEAGRKIFKKIGFEPIAILENHWAGDDYILYSK